MFVRGALLVAIMGICLSSMSGGAFHREPQRPSNSPGSSGPKRPIAIVQSADGQFLYVAHQRGGGISVIDIDASRVVSEQGLGEGWTDMAGTPDGRHLLAVDGATHRLVMLRSRGSRLEPAASIEVAAGPARICVSADADRCFVASTWSRSITFVDVRPNSDRPLRVARRIDLPFEPLEQVLTPDEAALIVADAFGGQVAVIDAASGVVRSIRKIPGHNIRGLLIDPAGETVLLSHQILSRLARSTLDDVHWGTLMSNVLRRIPLAPLLDPSADLARHSDVDRLGEVGDAAGDPAKAIVGIDKGLTVALAGVGQIAFQNPRTKEWSRLSVGRRPTDLLADPERGLVYVADTFGDAVVVVDPDEPSVDRRIALGPEPVLTATDRGERLFFDARLSHDGWMSCHSCHTDGHTNGLLNDNLGDGSYGAPKRVVSLRGVGQTGPWAWNGAIDVLTDQITKSVRTTMHGAELSDEQARDLEAFLRSLPPVPAPADRNTSDTRIARGQAVFAARDCARCHKPPTYTAPKAYDVGLADAVGNKRFNPPSLRGVGLRRSFFHDSRAATLDGVFARHRHQIDEALTATELADLTAFLRSL